MTQPLVVVTDYTFPNLEQEKAAAEKINAKFESHQCKSAEEVVNSLTGANVALVQFAPVTEEAISKMADGATIIRYGIGYDNIDLEAAKKYKVAVGYVPDYCIDEVADHTSALILGKVRKLLDFDQSVRNNKWEAVKVAKPMLSCSKSTVGFLGYGRIAQMVKSRLSNFNFNFIAHDPFLAVNGKSVDLELVDKTTLFKNSDIISLHSPLSEETKHIINRDSLDLMKPTTYIVNTARGELIDETALSEALKSEKIAGAALDVFSTEPLPETSILRKTPRLILTPHAAWYSEQSIVNLQQKAADEIIIYSQGNPPRCIVPGMS